MSKIIPYGRQDINQEDIDSVVEVLKSDFLTQGPVIHRFEKAISNYCGAKYTIAVNSNTSGLHLACLALGVSDKDWVWTSPISFVASANCAKYCGAKIDFIDIDKETFNISVDYLKIKLEKAKKENKLPKVIIPVHLCGQSCDMKAINELSKIYGFKIIEDAAHAIGGEYNGKKIGSCEYSDVAVFSFHPVKIITTGEGGAVLTNNKNLATKIQRLRSHGITRDPKEMTNIPDGMWYYQQLELGLNYRMTDIQAALGLSQLKRLDEFVIRRHEIAKLYEKLLINKDIIKPSQSSNCYSSYHLYVIRVKKSSKISRKQLFERMRTSGILVNVHYIPIYRHPYYSKLGYDYSNFPESEKYYEEAISIPIYYGLSDEKVYEVVEAISKPLNHQNLF